MKGLIVILAGATILPVISGPAFGHHSAVMYNHEKPVTITGTVTKFLFINPHSQIHLEVEDANGEVRNWIIVGDNPGSRSGWTSKTFTPGEMLTISGLAYKDGRPFMTSRKILRANGEEVIRGRSLDNP